MARRRDRSVYNPNLGLYLGGADLLVPARGLADCLNVRIRQQKIIRDSMGWAPFPSAASPMNLDGKPVLLITQFQPRNLPAVNIFGNTTDLFRADGDNLHYITPIYNEGTVSSGATPDLLVGTGTQWANTLKAGDSIHVGADDETAQSAGWYEITAVNSNTELVIDNEDATTYTDEPYTARQTFTAGLRTPYLDEVFYSGELYTEGANGDRWYVTNGVNPTIAWDGESDQVYFPDLGDLDTVQFLRRYKGTMVYGDLQVSGDRRGFSIRTSALGQPENVVTLEASEFVVHDGSDPLLNAYQLGDLLVLYGSRSITLAQFVGPPLMFVFRTAVVGDGPRGARAVAVFPDHHEFIGADSQYRFDGSSAVPINTHVWRELGRRMSPGRSVMIHNEFDEENGDLLWAVPLNTDDDTAEGPPQQAFAQHYLEDVGDAPPPFTRRELPATAFGQFLRTEQLRWEDIAEQWREFNYQWSDAFLQAAFPRIIFGDQDGNLFELNSAESKNGEPMTSFFRLGRRQLGGTSRKGVVTRIYPFFTSQVSSPDDPPLNVRLLTANFADGPATLAASMEYAPVNTDSSRNFVSPRKSARYAEVEYSVTAVNAPFAFIGHDLEVVPGGER